jgi:holo-[acyl-carrier protein] synthase
MVVGIGVDIVEVDRIEKALSNSQSMTQRVFSEDEIQYCSGQKNLYQHFAGRFAAKEAALKALGTGWQKGIRWKDVEVVSGDLGRPTLKMYRRAKEIFEESGATHGLVTITHAEKYAVAMVVLEANQGSAQ